MDISHRRQISFNSNLHTSPAVPSLPILCPGFPEMYSMNRADMNCKPMGERMYPTSYTMGVQNSSQNMASQKQENVIQSAISTFTNKLGEQLERATSFFIPNINNSISLTFVQTDSIFPGEMFKTLTGSSEKFDLENCYNSMVKNKESLIFDDNFYKCTMHGNKFESLDDYYGNTNMNTPTGVQSLDFKVSDALFMSSKKESDDKESFAKLENSGSTLEDCAFVSRKSALNETNEVSKPEQASKKETIEKSTVFESEKIDRTKVYENPEKTHSSDTCNYPTEVNSKLKNKDSRTTTALENQSNNSLPSTVHSYQTVLSNLITDLSGMVHKVVSHVTDRLHGPATEPSDLEMPEQSYLPKPRCKQIPANVSRCRGKGRGRGRSQLRRSGVSQARHRQERIRQSLTADIQEDLDDWHEFEELQYEDMPSTPSVDENGTQILYGADGISVLDSTICPLTFTVFELKPRKRKQKTKHVENSQSKVPTRVRYLSDCSVDCDFYKRIEEEDEFEIEKNPYRPRLLSESSVDSEDSCCIVFETGSDSEYEIDYDYDYDSTSDEDEEHQYEAGNRTPKPKVRFNMKPTIHTMYKWDYAYRTARRGPWEEMARDRERFRGRINSIGRVLDPVLTPQHRSHIWQQRFATEV